MIQRRDDFSFAARQKACSICNCGVRPLSDTDRNGPHECVVDTGIHIEFEGEFEICEHCAAEIARAIGYVSPVDLEIANGIIAVQERDIRYLTARLETKEQAVQVLSEELADAAHRAATGFAEGYDAAYADVPGTDEEPSFA